MIVTVTGNLVAKPKKVFSNQTGDVYSVTVGENLNVKTKDGYQKHTNWLTGLVSHSKVASILDRIDKGTCVHITATNAKVEMYDYKGESRAQIKLGMISSFMAGNLPQPIEALPTQPPIYANETYQVATAHNQPSAAVPPKHQVVPQPTNQTRAVNQAHNTPEPPQDWLNQMNEADAHLPF